MTNLQEFVDYVWSFYGEHSETIYPIKGLSKQDIIQGLISNYNVTENKAIKMLADLLTNVQLVESAFQTKKLN